MRSKFKSQQEKNDFEWQWRRQHSEAMCISSVVVSNSQGCQRLWLRGAGMLGDQLCWVGGCPVSLQNCPACQVRLNWDVGLVWFGLVWFGLVWFGLVSSACQVILQGCWLWPLWFGVDYICYSSKLILTILLLFIKDLRSFALEHWIFNLFELLLGKNKHHLRLLVHT